MSNSSKVTSIKKNELAPLQTKFQAFLLTLHFYFVAICAWFAKPFVWLGEQVDGGTSIFRQYNESWRLPMKHNQGMSTWL